MPTIAQFLVERLKPLTKHAFGVPGDYNLGFYDYISKQLDVVGTTDEQCAGFAADAYARVNDFGVVLATYCVGGFKLVNALAGAYAEKSPVLFISGSPGIKERNSDLLLHHMVGPFECQHEIFKKITCATTVIDDPTWAGYEIERVINTIRKRKQPGYIELPRDMVDKNIKYDVYEYNSSDDLVSDKENLAEAIDKSLEWLDKAKKPVILTGVEVARFGLGKELVKFAERANIPIACTLLGKSVVNERHPLFVGIYCGGMSEPRVKKIVEQSDCVLMLGVMQTDMNMAFQPLKCDRTNVIVSNTGYCRIRRSTYDKVSFLDFVKGVFGGKISNKGGYEPLPEAKLSFRAMPGRKITSTRLFEKLNSILDERMAIIADVGDSLFGAADLVVHHRNYFIASAFYTSMGFAVPASLGVQSALPDVRAIVLVGDGSFQMTGMEFSTLVQRGYNPIVVVLNNCGYATERLLLDGKFNDLQEWQFHNIPDVVGGGKGYYIETEDELDSCLNSALLSDVATILNVKVDKQDSTPALKRMMENLSERI